MSYNGWDNYETWAVARWIDNFYGWREEALRALKGAGGDEDAASGELAEMLKDYINEYNPLADTASLYSDLLGAAISEVNWYEIVRHWVDDVVEEARAE